MASGRPHYSSLNSALRDTGRRSAGNVLGSALGALRQAFTRRPKAAVAEAHGGTVCTASGFALAGDRLLREARRLRQPLSMAVFDFEDLEDARDQQDRTAFHALLATVLAKLGELAGPRGIVGHTGPVEFSVLMPGVTRDQAHVRIAQQLGTPARVEYRGRRGDVLLMPSVETEQAGQDIERIMELHDELRYDLDEASSCQRQYLQRLAREREAAVSRPQRLDDIPPTIASPLAPRAADAPLPSDPNSRAAAT